MCGMSPWSGAGPAGLAAASAAAAAGARTIVLERAEHPRYKTCGGGLIGASRAAAGGLIDVPVARRDPLAPRSRCAAGRSFTRALRRAAARDGRAR